MENNTKSKLLFVINPVSGGNEKTVWETGIWEYFKNSSQDIHMVHLSGKDDADRVRQQIAVIQPDKVIAVGGDGTIKLVAEHLIGTDIPLGILPAGSANGMARDLALPSTVKEALDVVINGSVKKIDLIRINEKEVSIHLSDLGLNALMVRYYSLGRMRGKWGYAKALIRVLWQRQLIKTQLRLNGENIFREAFMIVLANARSYGTGIIINHMGSLTDGKFEVVILKEASLWELLKMMITNKPFDPAKIEVIQTEEVSITIRKKAFFQIDGEYRGKVTAVKARILPSALSILFPPE
jgi:YegS/Rv2252/BmrU family lipid kinase